MEFEFELSISSSIKDTLVIVNVKIKESIANIIVKKFYNPNCYRLKSTNL